MIKKTTNAVFEDGSYAGRYDWKGGMPLSEGEIVHVRTAHDDDLKYELVDKKIELTDLGEDQSVTVEYVFKLSS